MGSWTDIFSVAHFIPFDPGDVIWMKLFLCLFLIISTPTILLLHFLSPFINKTFQQRYHWRQYDHRNYNLRKRIYRRPFWWNKIKAKKTFLMEYVLPRTRRKRRRRNQKKSTFCSRGRKHQIYYQPYSQNDLSNKTISKFCSSFNPIEYFRCLQLLPMGTIR